MEIIDFLKFEQKEQKNLGDLENFMLNQKFSKNELYKLCKNTI